VREAVLWLLLDVKDVGALVTYCEGAVPRDEIAMAQSSTDSFAAMFPIDLTDRKPPTLLVARSLLGTKHKCSSHVTNNFSKIQQAVSMSL